MDNSDKLIEDIRARNIRPIPRVRFTMKNIITWMLFIISVIFGALAFSVILFAIQQLDFNLITHMSHSFIELVLALMPFFWIIALIIFLLIAMVSIRNSRRGYKFTLAKVVGFSVSFSILLGTLFFIGGGGQWLENAFAVRVSIYEGIQEKKAKIWTTPEEGYLSGTIISLEDNYFRLRDFNDETWTVSFKGADIPRVVLMEEGETVKMIGEMTGTGQFRAEVIRPWGGPERFRQMNKKNERNR